MPYADIEFKRAYDRNYGNQRREERMARSKAWREANRERYKLLIRKWTIFRKYKISLEQYDEILARQGGVCAICGSGDRGKSGHPFSVDHCHRTGAIRGILCKSCNTAIGQLDDDPGMLVEAIEYLCQT